MHYIPLLCVQEHGHVVFNKATQCTAQLGFVHPSCSPWYQFSKQCQQFQMAEQG